MIECDKTWARAVTHHFQSRSAMSAIALAHERQAAASEQVEFVILPGWRRRSEQNTRLTEAERGSNPGKHMN
jgi:hypothetical protein